MRSPEQCVLFALWQKRERQDQIGQTIVVGKEVGKRHTEHLGEPFRCVEVRLVDAKLIAVQPGAGRELIYTSLDAQLFLR